MKKKTEEKDLNTWSKFIGDVKWQESVKNIKKKKKQT